VVTYDKERFVEQRKVTSVVAKDSSKGFFGNRFVHMIKENILFLREFLLEFKTTGACFPTSRWAAQALITPLRKPNRPPKNILELGPGTGSVTLPILKNLQPGDRLTICEINPRFMRALKDKLEKEEAFTSRRSQVSFFEGAAQDLPEEIRYDIIVCALPFVNFDLTTVQEIFSKLRRISSPDTLMTYYEYIGLRKFNQAVAPPERRQQVEQVNGYIKESGNINHLERQRVWLNMLPINIYTVKPAA
jgi:phospholipid N-methyltransferase